MEKVPFGKSRLASYAAALWLIKEEKEFHGTDEELQESFLTFLETDWKNNALILKEKYEGDMDKKTYSKFTADIDEKKMTADAKRKQNVKRATPAGKKAAKKSAKKAAKYFKATGKTSRDPQAAAKKARKAKMNSYVPGGSMIEKWKNAAFDKVRAIRSRLGEGLDAHAARELKLYIEQDRDLYRQQIVPIIKNVQRKMKSGKYDHAQAPKLWLYLVDNGAKKYVKEFGGDVKRDWPKDLRMSIANEFANEYKAEIEIQGGEMI